MDIISNKIQMERCMVILMNKKEFIKELEKETGLDENKCIILNDCMEEYFKIGKKNKEKTVALIQERLELEYDEADNLYNIATGIMLKGIKNSIFHPFKSNKDE